MPRRILIVLCFAAALSLGGTTVKRGPGGGGTGDIGTLTDTGNLCGALEVVTRDAGDTSFECSAAGAGSVTDVGNCNGAPCFTGAEGTTLTSTTGEIIDLGTANTFIFQRNDAGVVLFAGKDDAGSADTVYGTTGIGAATLQGETAVVRSGTDVTIDLDDSPGDTSSLLIRDGLDATMLSLAEGNTINFYSAAGEDVGDRAGSINMSSTGGICFESTSGVDQCILEGTNQITFTGTNVDMTGLSSSFYAPLTIFFGRARPSGAGSIVGSDQRCIELLPKDITCFGANGCAGETIDGTGHSFVTANFATDADDSGSWVFSVPKGWTTWASTVEIDWTSNHADCDNNAADTVCWAVDSGSVTDDGAFVAPTLGGTAEGITDTCIANGDMMRSSILTYTHGMTDGHSGILVVTRDVDAGAAGCTTDSYTQDAKIVAARICRDND